MSVTRHREERAHGKALITFGGVSKGWKVESRALWTQGKIVDVHRARVNKNYFEGTSNCG